MIKERIIQVAEGLVNETTPFEFSYMPTPEITRVKGMLAAPFINVSIRFNKQGNLTLSHVDEGRYFLNPPDDRILPLNETMDGSPIKGIIKKSSVVSGKNGDVIGKIYLIVETNG